MERPLPDVGMVVMSRAGRDAGRYFVVLQKLDENYVWIVDGDIHKIDHPKKKKIKHLDPKPVTLPQIKLKLAEGQSVYDFEIRMELEALGYK